LSVIFPKWTNRIVPILVLTVPAVIITVISCINTYATDDNLVRGYQPEQPIDFMHTVHAGKAEGQLAIDCRYCHVNVEKSPVATVPPSQVCMNCHRQVKNSITAEIDEETGQPKPSEKLKPLFDRQNKTIEVDGVEQPNPLYNTPIPWVRVHQLPDFVYFDHSVHANANVGCTSCHGRIDEMTTVHQDKALSMRWCLECHDNPEMHIRPEGVAITQMDWNTKANPKSMELQEKHSHHVEGLIKDNKLNPPRYCSACHR
jgi:hypothetical protein